MTRIQRACVLFTVLVSVSMAVPPARAHRPGLHFSHPLVAESPSPDTKVRLDYLFRDVNGETGGARESTLRLEGEYAFHRTFSIEVDFPVVFLDPGGEAARTNVGTAAVGLKFANFAFEEQGVLLGYGIEFGLPTGDGGKGIGSDHVVEVETFLNAGYLRGGLEAVVFTSFGIPTNQGVGEEAEAEFAGNLSVLYHVTEPLSLLVELDGGRALSGPERGHQVLNLSPGVKWRPVSALKLDVGGSVGFPVSSTEAFDVRTVVSVFYHF